MSIIMVWNDFKHIHVKVTEICISSLVRNGFIDIVGVCLFLCLGYTLLELIRKMPVNPPTCATVL